MHDTTALPQLPPALAGGLLERLLAIADDAVVVADAQQRVVLFNEGAERTFGWRRDEMLGQPIERLLPEASRAGHAAHVRAFGASPQASRRMGERRDIRGCRADGTLFDAEASISHVVLDGHMFFAAIVRDVTEARAARAEAEAAAQAKSLFLANMSHEIRTPLNAVIGMTSLLLDTAMSDEQRDYARTIRASGETLLATLNDILDFSKAEAGRLELEQQVFDLRRCVEDALDLVAAPAQDKGLNLACLIEDGTPEMVVGDASRLRQILVNLLSNAVKFTHQGEVYVAVDSLPLDDGRRQLRLAVHDTGIGITAEHLPRLFQSFMQVDASTTRHYGGTGLGLAISRRLAELMGGGVSVRSEPGRGSVFELVLPVSPAPVGAAPDFLQRNVPLLHGKRVLIVDDNLTNRRILSRLALRWGMEPATLPSALEALDRVRHGEPFDLAILDMSMPGMDGLTLAGRIHALPAAQRLPIVLLSSLGQRVPAQAQAQAQAQAEPDGGTATGRVAACLAKPIKAAALYQALLAVLPARAGAVLRPGEPRPPQPSPAPRPPALAERLPLRVLVAEDNPVNQRVALRLLQRLGYRADLAANGLEVLDAVERQQYDLVLMDIQMPEMDGLQAARWILQRRGASGLPRVVAMTANALPGDRERALAAGIDGYLSKPIDPEALACALLAAAGAPGVLDPRSAGLAPGLAALAAGAQAAPASARAPGAVADAVLDASRLDHLHALQDEQRPTLVRDLIDLFMADALQHEQALAQALAGRDPAGLRHAAHRFLSSTQNIGAHRLASLCEAIECAAHEARLDTVPPLVDALAAERERVVALLAQARERY